MVMRLFFKNLKDKDYFLNFSQRLGLLKGEYKKNPIWFHAVSLGEVISSQLIVRKLLKEESVILSVSTPTGLREAKKIYNDQLSIVYAPWDFNFFVKSFLNKIEPKALILFETEIWPSIINECWKKEIPVILSNARLSESSYKKYNRFKALFDSTLNKFSLILAQSNDHVDRFKALGINNDIVIRVGSTKFDFKQSESLEPDKINHIDDFILAASTHIGEDEVVINSFKRLKEEFLDLKLIIVPRHPERAGTIKQILRNNKMNFKLSSDLDFNTKENDILDISSGNMIIPETPLENNSIDSIINTEIDEHCNVFQFSMFLLKKMACQLMVLNTSNNIQIENTIYARLTPNMVDVKYWLDIIFNGKHIATCIKYGEVLADSFYRSKIN